MTNTTKYDRKPETFKIGILSDQSNIFLKLETYDLCLYVALHNIVIAKYDLSLTFGPLITQNNTKS